MERRGCVKFSRTIQWPTFYIKRDDRGAAALVHKRICPTNQRAGPVFPPFVAPPPYLSADPAASAPSLGGGGVASTASVERLRGCGNTVSHPCCGYELGSHGRSPRVSHPCCGYEPARHGRSPRVSHPCCGYEPARHGRSPRVSHPCCGYEPDRDGIEALLPEDAHKRAEGRLHISISSARSGHNRIVSSYGSRQELVQVILASSFIPFYAGLEPVTYDGECWFDGGLTNNLPVLERGRTITVSPFSGQHDICPCDPGAVQLFVRVSRENFRLNVRNALRVARAVLPPPRRTMEGVFHCGFQDAARFLHAEKWDRSPQ
ncbi:1-acylglycerol-3-phosphate O-acyltransferase Pnpla3-like [Petromyzon marinus]|uniref:1-acylglycerol-3-phosphate O-acyltransferase Pnpla3-like n=1 Tax=Petromyzon marinus TaxID=7757 RepID=UPI003F72464E